MNILDTLMNAAKGATAGAVAGPIGAAVGGLGGLVVDIAPDISKWLFGSGGEKTAGLLAQAVETVTGTKDADAAQKVLEREPEAVLKLQQQIAGIVAQQQAEANRAGVGATSSAFARAWFAAWRSRVCRGRQGAAPRDPRQVVLVPRVVHNAG
jgi:hypothetical protein